jgi:hypothetical protein
LPDRVEDQVVEAVGATGRLLHADLPELAPGKAASK